MTAALKIKLPTIKSQCYQTLDMKPRVVSRSHCGVYRTPYRTAGYTVPTENTLLAAPRPAAPLWGRGAWFNIYSFKGKQCVIFLHIPVKYC